MSVSIVSFKVTGISPILMNNPASMQRQAAGLNQKKIPTPEEEAKAKIYADDKGNLFVPSLQFRSALLGACAGRRMGKTGVKFFVSGGVFSTNTETPLVHPKTGKPLRDYKINIARAVVGKAGILRARPEVYPWACQLDFEIDNTVVADSAVVLELLNIAGKVRGIGDWRPQKGGPYGRFAVEAVVNTVRMAKAG